MNFVLPGIVTCLLGHAGIKENREKEAHQAEEERVHMKER